MGNKDKYQQHYFDNDHNRNSDFDLDEYIREQSQESPAKSSSKVPLDMDDDSSQFKNALLVFIVFATAFLWYNNWNPAQAWNSIFGSNETSAEVTSTAPSFTIPDIPQVPEIPQIPALSNETGFVNYLLEINEAGIDDSFSSSALQAFYQSGIPVTNLSELVEAEYQDLSYPAIIAYYNADVPLEYLNTLNDNGYLSQFSFPEVIAYYNAEVSLEYLNTLNENGFLSEFSFPEVIAYYNAGVSLDYLNTLNEAGYLESLSYPAVISYFENGVTVSFLDRLRDNGLLENMSYPDVVSAFNTDN